MYDDVVNIGTMVVPPFNPFFFFDAILLIIYTMYKTLATGKEVQQVRGP